MSKRPRHGRKTESVRARSSKVWLKLSFKSRKRKIAEFRRVSPQMSYEDIRFIYAFYKQKKKLSMGQILRMNIVSRKYSIKELNDIDQMLRRTNPKRRKRAKKRKNR